jgi:hypothetical protein
MTSHNRYLSDQVALCAAPERLDFSEAVFADWGVGGRCKDCSALLMEANKRAYDADLLEERAQIVSIRQDSRETLGDIRWIIYGAMAGTSGFWIGFFLALKYIWGVL